MYRRNRFSLFTIYDSLVDGLRYYDPQSAGSDAVVERRAHDVDFAVSCDAEPSAARLDPNFLCAERIEIFGLTQSPHERAEGETHESPAPDIARQVKTQLAGVEA